MRVFNLLSDESKWTSWTNARNANNESVGYADESACKWCVIGAIRLLYPGQKESSDAYLALMEVCKRKHNMLPSLANDNLGYEAILDCIKEAGI